MITIALAALAIAGASPSPEGLDPTARDLLAPICETAAQKMVYNEVEERAQRLLRTPAQVIGDYHRELERRMLALGIPDSEKNFFRAACEDYTQKEAPRIIDEAWARMRKRGLIH